MHKIILLLLLSIFGLGTLDIDNPKVRKKFNKFLTRTRKDFDVNVIPSFIDYIPYDGSISKNTNQNDDLELKNKNLNRPQIDNHSDSTLNNIFLPR